MESFAFDQSEAGSEGSYDTSLGSFEDSNYNMMLEPGYLEAGVLDPSAPTFYSAWEASSSSSTPSLVSVLPTQHYCDHSNTGEVRADSATTDGSTDLLTFRPIITLDQCTPPRPPQPPPPV